MIDIAKLRELMRDVAGIPWSIDQDEGRVLGSLVDPDQPKRGREIACSARGNNAALIVAAVNGLGELLDRVEALENVVKAARRVERGFVRTKSYDGYATATWNGAEALNAFDLFDVLCVALDKLDEASKRSTSRSSGSCCKKSAFHLCLGTSQRRASTASVFSPVSARWRSGTTCRLAPKTPPSSWPP